MISQIIQCFKIITDFQLEPDSMWFRKSNFFTIVVELTQNIKTLPQDIRERLLELEANVMSSRLNTNSEFYEYYSCMYQGTHSRNARVKRGDFFKKYCLD